jgi:hypothetical protein
MSYNSFWLGIQLGGGIQYKINEKFLLNAEIMFNTTISNIEYRKPLDLFGTFQNVNYPIHVEDIYSNTKPSFFQKSFTDKSTRPATQARQLGLNISLVYNINLRKDNQ